MLKQKHLFKFSKSMVPVEPASYSELVVAGQTIRCGSKTFVA